MTTADADNDFEKISQFVSENAVGNPELVRQNLELVRPIFENILSGRWKFGKWIDVQELLKTIRTTAGVNKIVLVSISSISRLPRQVSTKLHDSLIAEVNSFGCIFKKFNLNLRASLNHNTRLNFRIMMDSIFGKNFHDSIQNSLDVGFKDKLQDQYASQMWLLWRNNVKGSLRIQMASVIASSIYQTLINFLSLVLIGDTEKIQSFAPIIRLMATGVVPLCEKVDEPGSYLVAVA